MTYIRANSLAPVVAAFFLALGTACGGPAAPMPEVVASTTRVTSVEHGPTYHIPGLIDYTVWVDCTVKNNGGAGTVFISGKVANGGLWTASMRLRMEAGAEEVVSLSFTAADAMVDSGHEYTYECRAQ